ncbi:hypothetical protein GOODEAATRI_029554 [Goodea atripinnis]|uniref:Uncharacterized protein n=1 Tax=Goodea atripinnis TaxID=208336 RepID=A0ABV0PI31_9TELE
MAHLDSVSEDVVCDQNVTSGPTEVRTYASDQCLNVLFISLHRKDNAEQIARLTQAHRQIRRKYREQVWRLEQKVAAMMESQHSQSEAAKAAGEGSELRREETVL